MASFAILAICRCLFVVLNHLDHQDDSDGLYVASRTASGVPTRTL